MERKDYKQTLYVGIVLIALGGGLNPTFSPEPILYSTMIVSIGILLVILAIGSLAVRKNMNQRAASRHFYGLLLVGAAPAFLIYSQIAKTGYGIFNWTYNLPQIYFKTTYWWIFMALGAVFIVAGSVLIIWSWRLRKHEI